MPDVSFTNLLVVAAVAVLAPLAVGFAPRLRVPAVVLEIVGGIIIGPSGFGWVHVDLPVQILALFGLAFLLFLAGLEIDVHQLRGRLLRFAVLGYLVTLVLGYGAGATFAAAGWVSQPLLIAITLSATSLGLVVPVLKDAGQVHSEVPNGAAGAQERAPQVHREHLVEVGGGQFVGVPGDLDAALLTRMSSRPYSSITRSNISVTACSSDTSAATRIGRPPASAIFVMQISTPCSMASLVASAPSGRPT
jgi:Sodium/hydrogen exchanger family